MIGSARAHALLVAQLAARSDEVWPSVAEPRVPGCAGLQGLLQEGLTEFAGTGVQVSEITSFGDAWGSIDKVVASHEEPGFVEEEQWVDDGAVVLEDGGAAEALGGFFERVCTEWNIRKPALDDDAWQELAEVLRSEGETLQRLVQSGGNGARCEASQGLDPSGGQIDASLTRRAFVGALTEWAQMHDYHTPFANGPPAKGQPCAKVVNELAASECVECRKMFPRKDPRRKDLYRL